MTSELGHSGGVYRAQSQAQGDEDSESNGEF